MSNTVSLEVVQAQADALGINYHHRAGAEKIAGLVAAHLAQNPQDATKLVPSDTEVVQTDSDIAMAADEVEMEDSATQSEGAPAPVKPMTAAEYHELDVARRGKKIGALKRIRVTCMNPMKREWLGEIISVGSAKHGTFKKYVPFDGEPYHVPKIIYDVLKERNCTLYRTEQNADGRGGSRRVGYQAKEFAIDDLPPLTKAELEELRKKQQMAKAGL